MAGRWGGNVSGGGPTRAQMLSYRFVRWLVRVALGIAFRTRVRGRENLPRSGAYVVAPVHRSILDIFFTGAVITRRVRFMGKDSLWKHRSVGWLLTAFGAFPVDRDGSPAVAAKAAVKILEGGEPVVVYPEGTRRTGSVIEDLHDGAAYLAIREGIPIVPIGIGNTERILARGRKVPRFLQVAVVIGEPIVPPTGDRRARRALRAQLTARLQRELQALFDEAQALAGA